MNKILFAILVLAQSVFASFDNGWYLTTMMGCSFSGPSPLVINLDDNRTESISANYNNRCFEDSHWWSFRSEKWTNKQGIGFELIHHKIYLDNTTDLVERFSISDGYNLLFLNFAKQKNNRNYRVGLGVVYAHMDVTISGRENYKQKGFKGHYLTGPAFQINIEQILWESDYNFISLDSKFTAAYAQVPISSNQNETATAPDYALHFSLAFGSKPQALKEKPIMYALPLLYPITTGYFLGTGLLPGTD